MQSPFVFHASAATAAGFAALAGLVAAGGTNGIDEWAVNHAMPGARFTGGKSSLVDAVIPLHHVHWHGGVHIAAELVTLPAAFLTATILLALCCLRLGGRRAAALAAIYVIANGIEEVTKLTLTRPPLHHGPLHLAALDSSYPSGHAAHSNVRRPALTSHLAGRCGRRATSRRRCANTRRRSRAARRTPKC